METWHASREKLLHQPNPTSPPTSHSQLGKRPLKIAYFFGLSGRAQEGPKWLILALTDHFTDVLSVSASLFAARSFCRPLSPALSLPSPPQQQQRPPHPFRAKSRHYAPSSPCQASESVVWLRLPRSRAVGSLVSAVCAVGPVVSSTWPIAAVSPLPRSSSPATRMPMAPSSTNADTVSGRMIKSVSM